MNCLYPFVLITLLFDFSILTAQTSLPSTSGQAASYENITAYYQNEMGADSRLYIGKEYPAYKSGIQGTQFFVSPEMQNGTIFYGGVLYEGVPFLFDVVRQDVVINRYDDNTRMKLLNEKIKYFIISGHRFANITIPETDNGDGTSGFYDILLDGKASVLVSRIKKIEMTLNPEDPPKFTERDKIFIRNANRMYTIDKTNSILKALNNKKEALKIFIRKNKFRFKNNIEEELVKTVAYYESLTQ